LGGKSITIASMAKGAGMIGPNMATMLALVLTDAAIAPADAQKMLTEVADESFNCISVEGHTSTNDTLLLLASGAAGGPPLAGAQLRPFQRVLQEVCIELACQIPADGEGATHLIAIEVTGCASRDDARCIAQTIANSPLVKTAVLGGDPNWGRIVSAAGYAEVPFDPREVNLRVNGHLLYEHGAPVKFDAPTVSRAIKENHETKIALSVGRGPGACRFWTSDLTVEYVRFNADYST
jgi:glutamate N-acetyltransferase/amino-acid N-acetyltransferase